MKLIAFSRPDGLPQQPTWVEDEVSRLCNDGNCWKLQIIGFRLVLSQVFMVNASEAGEKTFWHEFKLQEG